MKPDWFSGDVVLAVDGDKVGELKGIRSAATYSSMTGYGLVIGRNTGTAVSHAYKAPFAFTGKIEKIADHTQNQSRILGEAFLLTCRLRSNI